MGTAAPICDNAFQAALEAGSIASPLLFLKYVDYASQAWNYDTTIPHLWAQSAREVRTLVCLRETRVQHDTYNDGEPAYQLVWEVRLVTWPDGRPFASNTFRGGNAPMAKLHGSGPGYGKSPIKEMAEWLLSLLHDRSIIYIDKGISSVAFSPDGNLLAIGETIPLGSSWSGTYQSTTKLWDLNDWKLANTLTGHAAVGSAIKTYSVTFSPDGKIVASGGNDKTILLWNAATGGIIHQLPGRDQEILSIVFSPDGATLISLDLAGRVSAWSVDTGDELWSSLTSPVNIAGVLPPTGNLAFTPDGTAIAVPTWEGVILMEVASGTKILNLPVFGSSLAYSPDGQLLAVGSNLVGDLMLVDAMTGQTVGSLKGHRAAIRSIAFSPDGKILASASADKTIILWDTVTCQPVRTLLGHTGDILGLAFSPDGMRLASGGDDLTVRIWDLDDR